MASINILKYFRKYKNLFVLVLSINFFKCKLENKQADSEDAAEKEKKEIHKNNIGGSNKINKKIDKVSKVSNSVEKKHIDYKARKSGSEEDMEEKDDEDEDKKEPSYQESEDEPTLNSDNDNEGKEEDIYDDNDDNDDENKKTDDELSTPLEEDTDSEVKVSLKYEDPGIMLPDGKKGLKVQTVHMSHPHGAHYLPHEYQRHGPKYEEDVKWLKESQRNAIMANLKKAEEIGLVKPTESKNKGLSAVRFKVKYLDIKDMKMPNYTWHIRKERNRRKLATRALLAHNKNKGLHQNPYKSIALVSFLRPRKAGENIFRKILYALWFVFIQRGNDPKKMVLSVNDLSDENYAKYLSSLNKNIITPANTKLELLEVFLPRKSDENDPHSMAFVNQMHIMDESTLLCYNTEFKDPTSGKIRQKNDKIYYHKIASFDWLGPLNNIPEEDYELPGKRYSWKKTIKAKVAKEISRKYMLFASKDSYNIAKEPFKGLKINRKGEVVGEFRVILRLTIGGICIGVINATANYIDLGTQDWGRKKEKPKRSYIGVGKMLRGLARFSDKHELGWFNSFE